MQEYEGTFMYVFMYIPLEMCINRDIYLNNKTFYDHREEREKKKVNKIFFLLLQSNPNPNKRRGVESLIQIDQDTYCF